MNYTDNTIMLTKTELELYGENILKMMLYKKFITIDELKIAQKHVSEEIKSDDFHFMKIIFADTLYFKTRALTNEEITFRNVGLTSTEIKKVTPITGTYTLGSYESIHHKIDIEKIDLLKADMEDEFTLALNEITVTHSNSKGGEHKLKARQIWMYIPSNRNTFEGI